MFCTIKQHSTHEGARIIALAAAAQKLTRGPYDDEREIPQKHERIAIAEGLEKAVVFVHGLNGTPRKTLNSKSYIFRPNYTPRLF